MSGWTPDECDELRRLWAEGKSASLCALELERSRNAIIGKVHRLKLVDRVTKSSLNNVVSRPHAKPQKRQKPDRRIRLRPHRVRKPILKEVKVPPVFIVDVPPPSKTWHALPGTTPIPFDTRTSNQCAWMIGDDKPRMCCGQATAEGKSWCPTHQAMAYRVPVGAERATTKPPFEYRVARKAA